MSFEMKLKFQCRRGLAKRNAERGVPMVGVCPSITNTNNNSYESREFWVSALQVANREWRRAEIGESHVLPHWVQFPFGIPCKVTISVLGMAVLWSLLVQGMRQSWSMIIHTHTAPIISANFSSCNKLLRAMKSGRWRPKSQPKLKPNRNLIHANTHTHTQHTRQQPPITCGFLL